jgi:hypothetical protein
MLLLLRSLHAQQRERGHHTSSYGVQKRAAKANPQPPPAGCHPNTLDGVIML